MSHLKIKLSFRLPITGLATAMAAGRVIEAIEALLHEAGAFDISLSDKMVGRYSPTVDREPEGPASAKEPASVSVTSNGDGAPDERATAATASLTKAGSDARDNAVADDLLAIPPALQRPWSRLA